MIEHHKPCLNVRYARSTVKAKCTINSCIKHDMADTRPEAAKRLQIARESMKIATPSQAAARFGWSRDTYIQHENGTRGLARAAAKYAKAYRVSEAWILTGTGPGPGEHAEAISRLISIYQDLPANLQKKLLEDADTAALAAEALAQKQGALEENSDQED